MMIRFNHRDTRAGADLVSELRTVSLVTLPHFISPVYVMSSFMSQVEVCLHWISLHDGGQDPPGHMTAMSEKAMNGHACFRTVIS